MDLDGLSPGLRRVLSDVSKVAEHIWLAGWSPASGGNLSIDVTEEILDAGMRASGPKLALPVTVPDLSGRSLLVTVSGARFRDIPGDAEKTLLLLQIARDGASYQVIWGGHGGAGKPTMEFVPHLRIHAYLQSDHSPCRVVLHTHPQHIIAVTHLPRFDDPMLKRVLQTSQSTAWVFMEQGVGLTRYMPMGSEQLAERTVEQIRGRRAVIWERHGCVAVGRDVHEALDVTDLLEKAAQVYLLCAAAGQESKQMTPDELASLGK